MPDREIYCFQETMVMNDLLKIINSVSFSHLFQVQPPGLNSTELDDPYFYTISIGKAADWVLLS